MKDKKWRQGKEELIILIATKCMTTSKIPITCKLSIDVTITEQEINFKYFK